jgi:hypothetical protein
MQMEAYSDEVIRRVLARAYRILRLEVFKLLLTVEFILLPCPTILRDVNTYILHPYPDWGFNVGAFLYLIVAHRKHFGTDHMPLYLNRRRNSPEADLNDVLFANGRRPGRKEEVLVIVGCDECASRSLSPHRTTGRRECTELILTVCEARVTREAVRWESHKNSYCD